MGRIGVSITKSVAFRNSTQEFSNVYYYNLPIGHPDETEANALIDAITAIEKTFHAGNVTFVRGRVWSQIGSEAQNQMIAQKNLSGAGARNTVTSMDKERAFLFRLRAGVDSRGNPVYLRKWFHACGVFYSGQVIPAGVLENSTSFTTAERQLMVDQVQGLRVVTVGASVYTLVSKSGRPFDDGVNWVAHQYLEHHQLGDQWRAA